MLIGGLQKFSVIDYPGKICAIIFTVGCNFRCPYCHNPELAQGIGCNLINKKEVLEFLTSRIGKIEAVTITGGEPTLHRDLINFIKKIKKLGFLIKLDSNGTNPEIIEKILDKKLVDYIAMDIKGPIEKYSQIVEMDVNRDNIKKSIKLIMEKADDYEFRTTIVKSQISFDDFEKIGQLIKGAKNYYLQKFIITKTIDKKFMQETGYNDKEMNSIKKIMRKYVKNCYIR